MAADWLPLVLAALVAVWAIVGMLWLERRFERREVGLRKKLGACRTALEASEADRDRMRRQFNAQSVELARYRGNLDASHRLTQVYTGLPEPPDE